MFNCYKRIRRTLRLELCPANRWNLTSKYFSLWKPVSKIGCVYCKMNEFKREKNILQKRFSFRLQSFESHADMEIHWKLINILGKKILSVRTVRPLCRHVRNGDFDVEEQWGSERTRKTQPRRPSTTARHVLSLKISVEHVTYNKIRTQMLKISKLCRKWVSCELTLSYFET